MIRVNNESHRNLFIKYPKRGTINIEYTYVFKNKEGKVRYKYNKEKEENNVTNPGGHITTYSHDSRLYRGLESTFRMSKNNYQHNIYSDTSTSNSPIPLKEDEGQTTLENSMYVCHKSLHEKP